MTAPLDETHVFIQKVWQIMTSCDERRREEYEKTSWWDFIQAAEQTRAYQKFFGHGITRSLVAGSGLTVGSPHSVAPALLAQPNELVQVELPPYPQQQSSPLLPQVHALPHSAAAATSIVIAWFMRVVYYRD